MRLLDRYVIKELIVPFAIGTVGLVLMFQANFLIAVYKEFAAFNIPFQAVAQLILYKTPEFLKMTLPAGMALATALTVSRLARESEITAMRASGAPIARAFVPLFIFGIAVGALNFYVAEKLQPEAEQKFKTVANNAAILGAQPDMASNVMVRLGTRGFVYFSVITTDRATKRSNFRDVVYMEQMGDGVMSITTAPEGSYDKGIWTLKDSLTRVFRGTRLEQYKADQFTINEQIHIEDMMASKNAQVMKIPELWAAIAQARKMGVPTDRLEVELHSRYSIPVACFVFALTGPVLAMWFGRSGAFTGVLLSIFIVMAYYNVYVVSTEIFVRNHWFSPAMGAWFPDILFFVLGAIGVRRLE